MGKSGKSDNRTCGQTGHCPAMSGVRQPDGHGHLPRYMSCLSGFGGRRSYRARFFTWTSGNQMPPGKGRQTMTNDCSSGSSRNNARKTGPGNPPIEHQFKPGNPGRPKGSRNKLGEDFIAALAEDFTKHGAVTIEQVRRERPDVYLRVIGALLPKDLNLTVRPGLDELSDEQLLRRLRTVTEIARPLLAGPVIDVEPTEREG